MRDIDANEIMRTAEILASISRMAIDMRAGVLGIVPGQVNPVPVDDVVLRQCSRIYRAMARLDIHVASKGVTT